MKSKRPHGVLLAVGFALAFVLSIGTSSLASAAPPVSDQIMSGQQIDDGPVSLPDEGENDFDVAPQASRLFSPKPGNGYKPNSSDPASNRPWEIKLTSAADRAGLRSAARLAAADFTAATGVVMTVAPGTVSSSYKPEGEEVFVDSTTDAPCKDPSEWIGCGGTTMRDRNDLGVKWIVAGRVWINPSINGQSTDFKALVLEHEIGHVMGLWHFDGLFEGKIQVMNSTAETSRGYKSGDRNGLLNALDKSTNKFLDSSVPGLVTAAGEQIDFDGDGKSDVFSREGSGGWRYSSGGTKSWKTLASSAAEYQDLRFGDFDGDGKTDVFTSVWKGSTYQWMYRSGGNGDWKDLGSAGLPLDQLRFGDFDKDGKTDVFVAEKEGNGYRWKYSSAGVTSWKNLAFAGNPVEQLRFGDFDGDAKTDVFIAQKEGRSYRWKYSSGGATSWKNLASAGNPIEQLRFGDFDKDGKTDVFIAQKEGRGYRWKYSSAGKTNWKNLASAGNPIEQLRFGDFDRDGKTDVFTRGGSSRNGYWQYSSGGAGNWKRLARANEAIDQLRVS